MSAIDSELINIPSTTKNANIVKDIILSRLIFDKIITTEQHAEFSKNWQVIIVKNNWFKKLMGNEGYHYYFVKLQE